MTDRDGKCDVHGEYVDDVGDCPVCEDTAQVLMLQRERDELQQRCERLQRELVERSGAFLELQKLTQQRYERLLELAIEARDIFASDANRAGTYYKFKSAIAAVEQERK
jgi:hypothetical protein